MRMRPQRLLLAASTDHLCQTFSQNLPQMTDDVTKFRRKQHMQKQSFSVLQVHKIKILCQRLRLSHFSASFNRIQRSLVSWKRGNQCQNSSFRPVWDRSLQRVSVDVLVIGKSSLITFVVQLSMVWNAFRAPFHENVRPGVCCPRWGSTFVVNCNPAYLMTRLVLRHWSMACRPS